MKAIRWAQFRLKQRLEAIDFMEDVLMPEIEALKSGGSVLGLPAGVAFDIQIESVDANPDPPQNEPGQ
jgi:hypothetical protein